MLSSRFSVEWALRAGGLGLGNDPRYSKSRVFDPFPFPYATPEQPRHRRPRRARCHPQGGPGRAFRPDAVRRLRSEREGGEGRAVQRSGAGSATARRIDIIAGLHDRIKAAVADAYGWPHDLSDEQIVERLVALNAERHAEEQEGKVRWLRPDYQIARAGLTQLPTRGKAEQIEALLPEAKAKKPAFPRDAIGQTAAVLADLRRGGPLTAAEIAGRYSQGRKVERRIAATLGALVRLGHVAAEGDRYRLRRAA